MAPEPEPPQGLGTPSSGQPGFAPPDLPLSRTVEPGRDTPAQAWSAPLPAARVATPPSGRGPHRSRRTRTAVVAAVLAGALLLIGILSALPLLSSPTVVPGPEPSTTPTVIVTVSPSPQPSDATTSTSGGDIGRPVDFRTGDGAGIVTVHSAVWTDAGDIVPLPGERYLVLDVSVEGTDGAIGVDALLFLADGSGGPVLPGFGPALNHPLGGQVLQPGDRVRGQIGYSLPAGPVQLELLDEQLRPVARIEVPGP